MTERITLPVKAVNGKKWAQISVFGSSHHFCAEDCRVVDQNYSFAGGHRVRRIRLKKNVHWEIPEGIQLDIAGVPPAQPPRRQP